MLIEQRFGCLEGRELTLRWCVPWRFTEWTHEGERFVWWRLLNPVCWFWSIFSKWEYAFWWVYHRDNNHRCYCPVGTLFDGRICIAGWGVTWFYSHFTGEVPCVCDKVCRELFPDIYGEDAE